MQYRQHRYPTQFPISLRTPLGVEKATITNVHSAGAQIANAGPVERGDKVSFSVLSMPVNGVVLWASGNRAGVVFRPELTADQLDTLRYRKDTRQVWRRGQVGFRFAEMR